MNMKNASCFYNYLCSIFIKYIFFKQDETMVVVAVIGRYSKMNLYLEF